MRIQREEFWQRFAEIRQRLELTRQTTLVVMLKSKAILVLIREGHARRRRLATAATSLPLHPH
jgi:hypothetical protein